MLEIGVCSPLHTVFRGSRYPSLWQVPPKLDCIDAKSLPASIRLNGSASESVAGSFRKGCGGKGLEAVVFVVAQAAEHGGEAAEGGLGTDAAGIA